MGSRDLVTNFLMTLLVYTAEGRNYVTPQHNGFFSSIVIYIYVCVCVCVCVCVYK